MKYVQVYNQKTRKTYSVFDKPTFKKLRLVERPKRPDWEHHVDGHLEENKLFIFKHQ